MKAGVNILCMPGTRVYPGGYMLCTIMPGGPYCTGRAPLNPAGLEEPGIIMMDNTVKIYPNPTTGVFTLAQDPEMISAHVHVEVFNIHGRRILSTGIPGRREQELSICGNPPGIYFMKVTNGTKVQTVKIILDGCNANVK
jgi:hypothetical protein